MFYVYVLKSVKDDGLYIGYTDDLKRRIFEHNKKIISIHKISRAFLPCLL